MWGCRWLPKQQVDAKKDSDTDQIIISKWNSSVPIIPRVTPPLHRLASVVIPEEEEDTVTIDLQVLRIFRILTASDSVPLDYVPTR